MIVVPVDRVARYAKIHRPQSRKQKLVRHATGKIDKFPQAKLIGTNKRVIDEKMPHLASLLTDDLAAALGREGLVIAAQKCVDIKTLKPLLTAEHTVLDVNGWSELRDLPAQYEGFCW